MTIMVTGLIRAVAGFEHCMAPTDPLSYGSRAWLVRLAILIGVLDVGQG